MLAPNANGPNDLDTTVLDESKNNALVSDVPPSIPVNLILDVVAKNAPD